MLPPPAPASTGLGSSSSPLPPRRRERKSNTLQSKDQSLLRVTTATTSHLQDTPECLWSQFPNCVQVLHQHSTLRCWTCCEWTCTQVKCQDEAPRFIPTITSTHPGHVCEEGVEQRAMESRDGWGLLPGLFHERDCLGPQLSQDQQLQRRHRGTGVVTEWRTRLKLVGENIPLRGIEQLIS